MNRMTALTIALFPVFALCAGDISLPAPQKNGGMTLTETLASRRSVRKYTAEEVSMQALANVLWCANGISSPDGKRTAPSAMNRQEIIIYVTMKSGSFRYDAATHKLVRVSDADLRPQAGRYAAPVYLLLVADTQRQRSEIYAAVDTGYVSQNIYLPPPFLTLKRQHSLPFFTIYAFNSRKSSYIKSNQSVGSKSWESAKWIPIFIASS